MQGRGRSPGFGPRPPYQPGMQQGNWNQHQHQHQQPNHYRQQHAGAQPGLQQYALVPINGPGMNSPGMINGPPGPIVSMGPQGFNIGPGIMPAQMTGPSHAPGGLPNFSGGANLGMLMSSPVGAYSPAGPRPPPGQPPGRTPGRGGPQGRGPGFQGRGPGRGAPPGPGGRGPSPGRGRGPPGRGAPAQRGGRMGASPAGKEDRRNAKAMAKLDKQVQAEKPRVYKSLGAEDSQEAARWQAERRKHYPSSANLERKAQAASDRQTRGELEPDQALRRKQLQQVLMRQRELGLQQIAGTEDMHIDGAAPAGPSGRGGRGRSGRGGRFDRGGGRGRSPWGRGGQGRGGPSALPSGTKRPFDEGQGQGQAADKRLRTDGAADGLAGLMQYGSDNDDEEDKQAGGHAGVTAAEDDVSAQADAASAPQTEEERQALYQKHKEQVERQQQQHLASVEKKKKLQEKWASQGRGRGRGAAGRGAASRTSNSKAQQAQHAKRQPTLLQKLLVKDIRKDHSHVLQCFRFLVNNNFLQDMDSTPLVFPDPPPALRDILPSLQEEAGSEASDVDEDDVIHATAASRQGEGEKQTAAEESESESEEEEAGE